MLLFPDYESKKIACSSRECRNLDGSVFVLSFLSFYFSQTWGMQLWIPQELSLKLLEEKLFPTEERMPLILALAQMTLLTC